MDNPWPRALASLKRLSSILRRWPPKPRRFEYESLLRSELFSAEQMAEHGTYLASQHRLSPLSAADTLLARLADNESTLATTCAAFATALPTSGRVTPAAEWLLDNYYLVEDRKSVV